MKKILVIGDTIIDETWYVDTKKISPEAPVPVACLTSVDPLKTPGGASLATSYARKHNIPISFLTATDSNNIAWLSKKGIDVYNITDTHNVIKTRYIDKNSGYHLIRIDNDDVVCRPKITIKTITKILEKRITQEDIQCIVMLDYCKGVLVDPLICSLIIDVAKIYNIPTYVDTRGDTKKFTNVDTMKLNAKEYVAACAAHDINCPYALCKALNVSRLIVTKGKEGATVYENNKRYTVKPQKYTGSPDVTGCGDVFDINFCYHCFMEGFTPTKSLRLSVNKATEYAYTSIGDRLC